MQKRSCDRDRLRAEINISLARNVSPRTLNGDFQSYLAGILRFDLMLELNNLIGINHHAMHSLYMQSMFTTESKETLLRRNAALNSAQPNYLIV